MRVGRQGPRQRRGGWRPKDGGSPRRQGKETQNVAEESGRQEGSLNSTEWSTLSRRCASEHLSYNCLQEPFFTRRVRVSCVQHRSHHPPRLEQETKDAMLNYRWIGASEILTVGSSVSSPDGCPARRQAHLLGHTIPGMSDNDSRKLWSVFRCKPCLDPHDANDVPKDQPAEVT